MLYSSGTSVTQSSNIQTTQMDLVNNLNDVSEVRLDFTEQKDEFVLDPIGGRI